MVEVADVNAAERTAPFEDSRTTFVPSVNPRVPSVSADPRSPRESRPLPVKMRSEQGGYPNRTLEDRGVDTIVERIDSIGDILKRIR